MKRNVLNGKSVWITGASSGIGLELALWASRCNASLVLISSRKDALVRATGLCKKNSAGSVDWEVVDLSDTDGAFASFQSILERYKPPDYLILNAGISQRSLAGETDLSVSKKIMNINFFGVLAATRAVLPFMVDAGGGHIAVTSSIVGEFGFPLRSTYSASKKALNGYLEAVDLEYASFGIRTTVVMPGLIKTSISMNSLDGKGQKHGKMDRGQEMGLDAAVCAQKYWKAILKGRRKVLIGGPEIIMVFFSRNIQWLFRIIARKTGFKR